MARLIAVWWPCLRSALSVSGDYPWSAALTVVTSLLAAPLADNFGRRITLRLGAFIFTLGGGIQTFCSGFWTMVLGRIISGFGVGMLSMIVPIYQVGLRPSVTS